LPGIEKARSFAGAQDDGLDIFEGETQKEPAFCVAASSSEGSPLFWALEFSCSCRTSLNFTRAPKVLEVLETREQKHFSLVGSHLPFDSKIVHSPQRCKSATAGKPRRAPLDAWLQNGSQGGSGGQTGASLVRA
jgi:hypothetical protein